MDDSLKDAYSVLAVFRGRYAGWEAKIRRKGVFQ